MLGFCSALYVAMFLPALRSASPGPKAAPGSSLGLLSAAALLAAGACLALEATADVQQQLYYEAGGASPCRAGVWRWAHNANYHVREGGRERAAAGLHLSLCICEPCLFGCLVQ